MMEENKLEIIQMMTKHKEMVKNMLVDKFHTLYYEPPTMERYNTLWDIAWTLEYMGYDDIYDSFERTFLNVYWTAKRYPKNRG